MEKSLRLKESISHPKLRVGTSLAVQLVKNLPSSAGGGGLILGRGTKILYTMGLLSQPTPEPMRHNWGEACPPQGKIPCATTKTSACVLNRFSPVRLFVTPWTITHQAPLSMGFSMARILEWVVMPSSRGVFLTQGLKSHLLCLLHWQMVSFTTSST